MASKQRMTVAAQVEACRQQLNLNGRLALNKLEATAALGFRHTATVDRLCQRGLLHPSRASRRPIFPVDEIRRFLAETT